MGLSEQHMEKELKNHSAEEHVGCDLLELSNFNSEIYNSHHQEIFLPITFSYQPIYKVPYRHAQRSVSNLITDPVKLIVSVTHHTS